MNTEIPLSNFSIDTTRIQFVAIAGSILLLLFIFELTRKGKIRVPYSLLWFILSVFFLSISIWRELLEKCAIFIGIAYAPAALFLLLIISIIGILIHFSVVLSTLSERTRKLVQELSIMQLEFKKNASIRSSTRTTTDSPDKKST
jgi:hypothetical protein